jgi:plastocyanin
MSIRTRVILVLAGAMALTTILAACSGGPTTEQIVQTAQAQNKLDNAQATRQAVIDAGGDPDEQVQVVVDSNSAAALAANERNAEATAQAEKGIISSGVGGAASDELAQGAAFEVDVPEGAAESGEVVVEILTFGAEGTKFVPETIKVTVGSTVKWVNDRRSAASSTAHPGQEDQWDSGSFSRGTFDKEAATFEHTFSVEGCFTYESQFSGDTNTGAVCVVAE